MSSSPFNPTSPRLTNSPTHSPRRWSAGLLTPALLLAGCISDGELLAENLGVARQEVRQRAMRDLGCAEIQETLLKEEEEPGQPLGELYSQYRIQARGCGKEVTYELLCRDQKLCSFKKP
jgi:hypothetical protein